MGRSNWATIDDEGLSGIKQRGTWTELATRLRVRAASNPHRAHSQQQQPRSNAFLIGYKAGFRDPLPRAFFPARLPASFFCGAFSRCGSIDWTRAWDPTTAKRNQVSAPQFDGGSTSQEWPERLSWPVAKHFVNFFPPYYHTRKQRPR